MTGSHETPDGPGAEEPEAEVASGAASRAGAFGVAGEQIDPTVADADVVDADVVDADVVDADVDDDATVADVVDGDEVIDGEVVDPLAAVTAQRDEYLDSLRRLQAGFWN